MKRHLLIGAWAVAGCGPNPTPTPINAPEEPSGGNLTASVAAHEQPAIESTLLSIAKRVAAGEQWDILPIYQNASGEYIRTGYAKRLDDATVYLSLWTTRDSLRTVLRLSILNVQQGTVIDDTTMAISCFSCPNWRYATDIHYDQRDRVVLKQLDTVVQGVIAHPHYAKSIRTVVVEATAGGFIYQPPPAGMTVGAGSAL